MRTKKFISVGLLAAGLALSSMGAVSADSTPPPNAKSPTAYAAQLAAYKLALIEYRVTIAVNAINYRIALEKYQADWQATLTKYEAPYKTALAQYQTLQTAYLAKLAPIAAIRKSALDKADADFLAAIAKATTTAQKNLALSARATAMTTANSAYKAAAAAIGAAPVKPVKPAELTKPAAPVKQASPVQPTPPAKTGANKK